MTDDDKKRIAEYMGWTKYPPECMGETVFFRYASLKCRSGEIGKSSVQPDLEFILSQKDQVTFFLKIISLGFSTPRTFLTP